VRECVGVGVRQTFNSLAQKSISACCLNVILIVSTLHLLSAYANSALILVTAVILKYM